MAYADDIVLVSQRVEGLKQLVSLSEVFFEKVHLRLNPPKTKYLSWGYDSKAKWYNYAVPPITLAGHIVHPVLSNSFVHYLGVDFYPNKPSQATSSTTLKQLLQIKAATLKPSKKVQCITTLLLLCHLYVVSLLLSYQQGVYQLISTHFRMAIKEILHLPQSFSSAHVHLPAKNGVLGVLSVLNVTAEMQFKAFARSQRMNNPFVNKRVHASLLEHPSKLCKFLGVPICVSSVWDVNSAVKESRRERFQKVKGGYDNKSLFSHVGNPLGNAWQHLEPHLLGNSDCIRTLHLRTNMVPTRVLIHRCAPDPAVHRYRFCKRYEEAAYHTLQDCKKVHLPRVERHNFLVTQIVRLVKKHDTTWEVRTGVTHCRPEGNLRPDIVVKTPTETVIADVAVTWDASEGIMETMNRFKQRKYHCLLSAYPSSV